MADKVMNLREKLHAIYEEIDHVEKAGKNDAQKYKYVKSADVLRVIRESLSKNRVYAETNFEMLGSYDITTRSGSIMHTATVKATIVFHDLDFNEKLTASGLGDGADSGDKGIYKAQTGALKNALRNAFLLPDEADPEADEEVDKATKADIKTKPIKVPTAIYKSDSVALPPKAEIPADLPKSEVAFSMPPNDGDVLPDENQMADYGERIKALGFQLKSAGLNDKGLPASRKIVAFLLRGAGVTDPNQISIKQFDTFLDFASNANHKSLAGLVEAGYK